MENQPNTTAESTVGNTNPTDLIGSTMPIIIGVSQSPEEKQIVATFNEIVENFNKDSKEVKFEIAVLQPELYNSSASLYYMTKLSQEQRTAIERAKADEQRKKTIISIIQKVEGVLLRHFKEQEQTDIQLGFGLEMNVWKSLLCSALHKSVTNKETKQFLEGAVACGLVYVQNAEMKHKALYKVFKNTDYEKQFIESRIQDILETVESLQSEKEHLSQQLLGILGVTKEDIVAEEKTEAQPKKKATRKPSAKKKSAKNTVEAVTEEGDLQTTTEFLNDRNNEGTESKAQ
jgi:hypothetical protein